MRLFTFENNITRFTLLPRRKKLPEWADEGGNEHFFNTPRAPRGKYKGLSIIHKIYLKHQEPLF